MFVWNRKMQGGGQPKARRGSVTKRQGGSPVGRKKKIKAKKKRRVQRLRSYGKEGGIGGKIHERLMVGRDGREKGHEERSPTKKNGREGGVRPISRKKEMLEKKGRKEQLRRSRENQKKGRTLP